MKYPTLRLIITNLGNTPLPGAVTVTAIRVPMNLRDLMSIATAAAAASNKTTANGSSSNNNMNIMMNPMQGYGAAVGGGEGNPTSSFMNNPLAFLRNIHIGSSNNVNANWNLPQSLTMGLVGMVSHSNSNKKLSSSPANSQTADFIVVSVIPFTGKSISGK